MKEFTAFSKYIPSIFAVSSPFQVLCAAAAIKQLEITDYRVAVCYNENDARNNQMWSVLDLFGMNDRVLVRISRWNIFLCKILSLISRKNRFKRLFIGDFRGFYDFVLGCRIVSDGADVVYLDDGNITLSLLNNVYTEPMTKKRKSFIQMVANRRNFIINRNLLTIYSGIKNPRFNIEILNLNLIFHNILLNKKNKDVVVIVGTYIDRYCEPLEIPKNKFVEKLDMLFYQLKIKYSKTSLVFIPHGRDVSSYAKEICDKHGAIFLKPKMMVELELIERNYQPIAIYGFTSSALYNLKKLYPQSKVVNILYHVCDNKFFDEYYMMSEYYQQHGIDLIKVDIA